jgi:hypothetical protein
MAWSAMTNRTPARDKLKINLREIFAVVRFSTFPTLSRHKRTHPIYRERRLKLPLRRFELERNG